MIKATCFIFVMLIISTTNSSGQEIREEFCKEISKLVVQPLKPSKIYHEISFQSSCSYDFDLEKGKHVIINVEKFNSKRESQKEFQEELEVFSPVDKKIKSQINSEYKKHWNRFYLYKSDNEDSFLLLRKNNFYISIITTDGEILAGLERSFQTIDFNKN